MKDKKFYILTIGAALILAVFIITAPNGYKHRDVVKGELHQLMLSRIQGKTAGDIQMRKAIIDNTVDHSMYVDDYYVCTISRMGIEGEQIKMSVGVLGHVFLINEDQVKHQLNKVNAVK